MQSVAELRGGQFCLLNIVAIRLINDDAIRHLHDATLNALQLITRTGQLDKQEEIHHGMHGGFTLPYADSLHEYLVEPGGLTQHDGLARLSCHTAQRTG